MPIQNVGETTQDSSDQDTEFLGAITETDQLAWKVDIQVVGHPVVFKMATGAKVTAINSETFKSLSGVRLERPTRQLLGPS